MTYLQIVSAVVLGNAIFFLVCEIAKRVSQP